MKITHPRRVTHTYEQTIESLPDEIFPLYCPVRELDWAVGWDPLAVYSESGVVEQDCVFVTSSEGEESSWIVTLHDPRSHHLEMWKLTPGVTACKLTIRLHAGDPGQTKAAITYSHTSLGPRGDRLLEGFTVAHYEGFMRQWEAEMNHYLKAGKKLDE